MIRVVLYDERVQIPNWVVDLESFRRWSDDDAFPETGQISFLKGDVWVDMSKEQLFDHNQVKSEINTVLHVLVKTHRMGRYFTDGAFLSNADADVSNQPDGMFVSAASFQQEQVRVVDCRTLGHVELVGRLEGAGPHHFGIDVAFAEMILRGTRVCGVSQASQR